MKTLKYNTTVTCFFFLLRNKEATVEENHEFLRGMTAQQTLRKLIPFGALLFIFFFVNTY